MAVGDISAKLAQLVIDNEAYFSHGANNGADIFVCLYGTSGSGYLEIRAISVDEAGAITLKDSWNTTLGIYTQYIVHISGNIFAAFYSDKAAQAGKVSTFTVDANGTITKSFIATLTFASGSFPEDVWLRAEPVYTGNNIWLIATQDSSQIAVWSIEISDDGATLTEKDKQQFALTQNKGMAMRQANDTIYALYSEQLVNPHMVYTFECSSAGAITSKDSHNYGTVQSGSPGMVKITDGVILISMTNGWETRAVAADGTIGAQLDTIGIGQNRYYYNVGKNVAGDNVIIYQSGDTMYTRAVGDDGTIGDQIDTLDMVVVSTGYFHFTEGDDGMWVSFLPGGSTFDLYAISFDVEPPPDYWDRIYVFLGTEADPEQIELTDPDYPTVFGVRTERGRDEELGSAAAGIAEVTCDNHYGDYSPERVDGTYYGTLKLGAYLTVFEVYLTVKYPIFAGKIDEITPHPEPDNLTAFILAVDGMDDLNGSEVETALREDTDEAELVDDVLDGAGWSATKRSIDTGVDTLQLGWFHEENALPAINSLEDSTRGFFLVDPEGNAVWQSRHYRVTGARLTSQFTFNETLLTLGYKWSKKDVKNWVRVTGHQYTAWDDDSVMWYAPTNFAGAPFVPAGATIYIWASLAGARASSDALVKDTHWSANTAYDGSGDDIGDDITVTPTYYGQAIKFAVANAGTKDGYLTVPSSPPSGAPSNATLLVIGKLYEEATMSVIEEDSTSQTDYGKRTLSVDARFKSNYNDILSYAQYLKTRGKDPLPTPVSAEFNVWAEYPADDLKIEALTRAISDRVTAVSAHLGVDQDYYVDKVIQEYAINEGGTIHLCTFVLSRAEGQAEGQYWLIGVTGFSELGLTTRLGF